MTIVMKAGKIVALATFLGLALSSVSAVAAPRDVQDLTKVIKTIIKAPREGSAEVPCACSSTSELDAIRSCICYIRTLLGSSSTNIDILVSEMEVVLSTLGQGTDTVVPCLITLADINNADLSVVSWLKTIYAEDLGWAGVPCP